MHAGPDSILAKEGVTGITAMNPVEFFQTGIYYWVYKSSQHSCGENSCEQKNGDLIHFQLFLLIKLRNHTLFN